VTALRPRECSKEKPQSFWNCVFCGHKVDTEERLRLSDDKEKLVYNQFMKGPNGKEGRYEIEFGVPEQRPRVDGA